MDKKRALRHFSGLAPLIKKMYVGINNMKGNFHGQGAPLLDLGRSPPPDRTPKQERQKFVRCHVHSFGIDCIAI